MAARKKTTKKKATKAAKKSPVAKKATKKKATKKAATKKKPAKVAKKATKRSVAKKATKRATAKKAPKKAAAKKATKKKATKKVATKRATAKKATAHKAVAVKVAPKRVVGPAKVNFDNVKKARSKSQILSAISDSTGLSRNEVKTVFENLQALVGQDLKAGPGMFTLPGLLKMVVKRKPATKARKGTNPFTGEEMTFKAKPASNVVRARPLKSLKETIN